MAWTYTQNFNSLTAGDLNGQDSWSGDINYDVSTTAPYEGANSVRFAAATEVNIERTITGVTSGIVRIAMRKDSVATGSPQMDFILYQGTTYLCSVGFGGNAGGAVAWIQGAANTTLATGLSASTYYHWDLEFDTSTDQCRARFATTEAGLDSASWTAWQNFLSNATATEINKIRLSKGNGATDACYWDDIRNGAAAIANANFLAFM